jgi:hypothetical protein
MSFAEKLATKKARAPLSHGRRCRVHGGVTGSSLVRRAAPLLVALSALPVAPAACGRFPLDLTPPQVLPLSEDGAATPEVDAAADLSDAALDADAALDLGDAPPDLAVDLPRERAPEAGPDARPDLPTDLARDVPREAAPVEAGPVCAPRPETCNGVDDDCDGTIDQGLPAIPCPNGGSRYCVAGRYSECPRRCETCVPGSTRECFTTFCTFWGTQTCATDGRSFGACHESRAPAACGSATSGAKRTRALEDCCLAQGLCCVDEFDVDGDGDRAEMLGRCESVVCGP